MYITEFIPGERLVLEESNGEALGNKITGPCVMLIFAIPVLLLGTYSFLLQQPIPVNPCRIVIAFQIMFAVISFVIPVGARKTSFTPSGAQSGQVSIEGFNILRFGRRVIVEGESLYLRFDKGALGTSNLSVTSSLMPQQRVHINVRFLYTKEDLAHFVFTVANATGLKNCSVNEQQNCQIYHISSKPHPRSHPVPEIECNFPRKSHEAEYQFTRYFEPFDPARIRPIAKVHEWQPGRLLYIKPNELRERLMLAGGATLAVTLTTFWITSVVMNWPEAQLIDRALWVVSVGLIGTSALCLRGFDLLITGGTHFRVTDDGIHSKLGLWRDTILPNEISSICVIYLGDDAFGRKVEQVHVHVLAKSKSELVVKSYCATNICNGADAPVVLALEMGRILRRPVKISQELINQFEFSETTLHS